MSLQDLKLALSQRAQAKKLSIDYLPQSDITDICNKFDRSDVEALIQEQLPYPSKSPGDDAVYKLRCYLMQTRIYLT